MFEKCKTIIKTIINTENNHLRLQKAENHSLSTKTPFNPPLWIWRDMRGTRLNRQHKIARFLLPDRHVVILSSPAPELIGVAINVTEVSGSKC